MIDGDAGVPYEAIAAYTGDEHIASLYVGRHEHRWNEPDLACGIPNPSNTILCDLQASPAGQPHFLGQHLGWDRNSNLHGWKDTR